MTAFRTLALVVLLATVETANAAPQMTPSAATRMNASNFKDMVLAICVSRAYQKDVSASADAASSSRALVEWTRYDADVAPDEIERLVLSFSQRNYRNPLGDSNSHATQFSLLKCLDLYHSKELEHLSRRVVVEPTSTRRK